MNKKLCIEQECEPPYGGKEACEFNQEGVCSAPTPDAARIGLTDTSAKRRRAKLNPCPACGGNQKRTLPVKNHFETRYKVRCSGCGWETDSFGSKEDAHAVWNDCSAQKQPQRKTVPKKLLNLLKRRTQLARDLISACVAVDQYCEKLGMDIFDDDACLGTDIRIWCEFDGAYTITLRAVKKALGIEDEDSEQST